ncbi:MAG: phosphoadenylyl-sulfate reductase [Planctomycetaceae bacterium]|nr:phosphoadenylyl-sulfate reductase [Planctomycetaceae bacterium]
MAVLSQSDLAALNQSFEERTPPEIIEWAAKVLGPKAAMLSAMQMSGSVLCHMVAEANLKIDVVFVDTGVMFQETLMTRDKLISDLGLNVVTLTPELSFEEQTEKFGILYLSHEGQGQCCDMRKSQPLQKIKGRYYAFLGALRRDEGERRSNVPILAVDPEMNAIRVNPMANFTNAQLDQYIRQHRVYINPLHFQGFETIGCNRCTTPVIPGEPKRAGRWRHLGPWGMYCGINPTDRDGGTDKSIDLPQDVIDQLLGRETDFAI